MKSCFMCAKPIKGAVSEPAFCSPNCAKAWTDPKFIKDRQFINEHGYD